MRASIKASSKRKAPVTQGKIRSRREAKFHNIFKLFVKDFTNGEENDIGAYVYRHFVKERNEYVKQYMKKHTKKIQDGDIVYVGTGYEGRPEYGFGYVKNDKIVNTESFYENGKKALKNMKKKFPTVNYSKLNLNHWSLNKM